MFIGYYKVISNQKPRTVVDFLTLEILFGALQQPLKRWLGNSKPRVNRNFTVLITSGIMKLRSMNTRKKGRLGCLGSHSSNSFRGTTLTSIKEGKRSAEKGDWSIPLVESTMRVNNAFNEGKSIYWSNVLYIPITKGKDSNLVKIAQWRSSCNCPNKVPEQSPLYLLIVTFTQGLLHFRYSL